MNLLTFSSLLPGRDTPLYSGLHSIPSYGKRRREVGLDFVMFGYVRGQ
jgi:hypothetical protein